MPEDKLLDTECSVCKRVRWGRYQYLGWGHWRHEECYPGSSNWLENYSSLAPTEERRLIMEAKQREKCEPQPVQEGGENGKEQ